MQTDSPGILMVEDDEMLLEFYEAALAPEYEVLTAASLGAAYLTGVVCGYGGLQPSSRGYQQVGVAEMDQSGFARAAGPE